MAVFLSHSLLPDMKVEVTIEPDADHKDYKSNDKPIKITEVEFKMAYTILKYCFLSTKGPTDPGQPFFCLNPKPGKTAWKSHSREHYET